jgi:hypothetical protein
MRKPQTKPPKPKKAQLSDAEQYERFLDAAKKVGASNDPEDFDKAFKKVVGSRAIKAGPPNDS